MIISCVFFYHKILPYNPIGDPTIKFNIQKNPTIKFKILDITLFRAVIMLSGIYNISQNIPHIKFEYMEYSRKTLLWL